VADATRAQRQLQMLARAEMGGRLPGDLAAGAARDRRLAVGLRAADDRAHPPLGAGWIEDAAVAAGKARFDLVRATRADAGRSAR
jgi:hypothetical protein